MAPLIIKSPVFMAGLLTLLDYLTSEAQYCHPFGQGFAYRNLSTLIINNPKSLSHNQNFPKMP